VEFFVNLKEPHPTEIGYNFFKNGIGPISLTIGCFSVFFAIYVLLVIESFIGSVLISLIWLAISVWAFRIFKHFQTVE
jgi:hypothetical protein